MHLDIGIIGVAVTVLLQILDWEREMIRAKLRRLNAWIGRKAAEARREREARARVRAEGGEGMYVYKHLAEADVLGISEGKLAENTGMRPQVIARALDDMRRRDQAFLRGGRWYASTSGGIAVARWASRW